MKKLIFIIVLFSGVLVFHQCSNPVKSIAAPAYVGSAKCQACHKKEFDLYKTSDHFHAMDTALEVNVKGNFNNSSFIYFGDTAFFYKKDNRFFVRTTDTTGSKKEFAISYTFGWQPLQQYLVKFEDGRMQVLPFCWDTRDKEKGGQRWFHLYSKEKIPHTDELFWMGINQNWNYMCADCHTTGFKKKFSLSENEFHSSWNESTVSCESCHGPASGHMQWAETKDAATAFKGFSISLAQKKINWKMDAVKQTALPETVIANDTLIETCARCHARATRVTDEYNHGQSFLQSHIPATADAVNYYIDGQIKEEDYEYASFLQSKMYAAGVTCINCHEPHSMKVKASGNSLCSSCHAPAKYDGPQHSNHKTTGTGNQCVNCHMPTTTYMVIDNRLDHSIRIPRPDQSLTMGTPNACNKCHIDKPVRWAAENFTRWFAAKLPKEKNYAELAHNISRYINESEPSLYDLLKNGQYPAIIRATALEQYGYYASPRIKTIVFGELKSANAMLRLNALKALNNYPPEVITENAPALLFDAVRTVRTEAMNTLAPYHDKLTAENSKQFTAVMNEYLNLQEQMSHRPEGFFNRAILYAATGNTANAEQLYLESIKRFTNFFPSYNNLIDLYREQGRDDEAKKIIDKGLFKNPRNGYLHYVLALWYIRQKNNTAAMAELNNAASISPSDPQIAYGYAIGLFSYGQKEKAIKQLESYVLKYGNQPQVLDGLISMNQDMNKAEQAVKYTKIRKTVFGY